MNRLRTTLSLALKRILSQPGLTLATALGMFFAVSLAMSVPLYASSIYNHLFLTQLDRGVSSGNFTQQPFSFMFTYDTNRVGNLQWENVAPVEQFLENNAAHILGLPIRRFGRYFATNPLTLFPDSVTTFPENEQPLLWTSLFTVSDYEPNITITEGRYPVYLGDGPIEVLISEDLATRVGFQVGEPYTLFADNQKGRLGQKNQTIPLVIAGVYQVTDPTNEFWFIQPSSFTNYLFIPQESFAKRVSPLLSDEIYVAFWYFLADGTGVRPDMAGQLSHNTVLLQRQAEKVLPNIRLVSSPLESLASYQKSANLLTVLLFAYSIPIFGLLLAFTVMTSAMTVERQRNEIAVMRSRGAHTLQILSISIVESLILGVITLALALPTSAGIAQTIAATRTFLVFADLTQPGTGGQVITRMLAFFSPTVLAFGFGTVLIILLARLVPTWRAAGDTVVVYKRERSRSLRSPLWQRMWLDVLLMIPAAYGIYLLRRQGSIDALNAGAAGDPFANPLLIMVPSLAIFSLALFFLRLLPWGMSIVGWITARTRSVGIMLAALYLGRSPTNYTLPLLLLILTLSLSAFTATLAGTLDRHLHDQVYYQIGADARFRDNGDNPQTSSGGPPGAPTGAPTGPPTGAGTSTDLSQYASPDDQPGWYFLPVSEYLNLPNVLNAVRVGRYPANVLSASNREKSLLYGVDRYYFPGIAFWRSDFAGPSLGVLMNQLTAMPDGVLVPEDYLARNSLAQYDLVTLQITSGQTSKAVDFHIVGAFKLFPTYYPGSEPLFVANLDYIFQEIGGETPYEVWLKTNGSFDLQQARRISDNEIGAQTTAWMEAQQLINAEQQRPERQGLFGVLSVGFAAAALLTVLGFLLYALLSYQRRFVELGVLRAVGLSAAQMTAFLATELAFLILSGGAIGTILGVWVSNLFIPYLQVGGSDPSARIPPYVVFVAWPDILRVYILFGALFFIALVSLVLLLRRMRIFEAIKLGEAT